MTKRALNWASASWRIGLVLQVLTIGLIFGISRIDHVFAEGTTIHTEDGGQIAISNEHYGSGESEANQGSDEGNFTTGGGGSQAGNTVISDEFSGTTDQGEGSFTTPPQDNGGGGNGGGGGGGSRGGGGGGRRTSAVQTPVPTPCQPYLTKFVMIGRVNDPWEVKKLQLFLILHEGEKFLLPTGVYDPATIAAVERFQLKYAQDILTPWGLTVPTGHTFFTTSWTINRLVCSQDTANNFDLRNFYQSGKVASVLPESSEAAPATTTATTTAPTTTPMGLATSTGQEADAGFALLPDWSTCTWLSIILILIILWLVTRIYNLKQEINDLKRGGAGGDLPPEPDPKDQPPLDFDKTKS